MDKCLFYVQEKNTLKALPVFAVRPMNCAENTTFLVFAKNQWQWIYAKNCEVVDSERR